MTQMEQSSSGARRRRLAVVAFGGNALLAPDDLGQIAEQRARAEQAADWLGELMRRDPGHDLVVVHGNGPQVGQVLIQMEEAATKVPPGTLDVAVAQTQGSMGYLLELALRNRFRDREVAIVLGMVVVDGDDPGFDQPTKPVGPFFSRYRAEQLQAHHGWQMAEDAGRGWRKVVPSPRPLEVVGLSTVRVLLDSGRLVIGGGGGGIPVVRQSDGTLVGVEAVIDKDHTASLIGRELGADLLIILTGVPQVVKDFGKPSAEPLAWMDVDEACHLLAEGQFPAGSMGPKIQAAIDFVVATGCEVLITDIESLPAALAGDAGTRIGPASRQPSNHRDR
jgi:carbamate kinase